MRLPRIALFTLFAFGCATVRMPAGSPSEPADAPGALAPPVVELWLESSEDISPQVAAKADADARAALSSALAANRIAADALGARDPVLFVRERAVGLTEERRSQQGWAKVGIVAGVVVVVAAVVALIVTRGKAAPATAKGGSKPRATSPVAVKPRAVPVTPAVPPPPRYGRPYGGNIPISIGIAFWIPPRPLVLAPEPEEDPWWAPDAPPPLAPADELRGAPPPPDDVPGIALELPSLAEVVNFPVQERGFFAGPRTALQVDLLDRATGRVLWSNAVGADEDPRDAQAVAKLVGEALAGQRWASPAR